MDKKKLGNSIFDDCDDMIDYLFKDIIKDIEYAHEHRTKVNKLPNEEKVISIMEDIVYDYYGKFKYPSDFYKELYLRLK